MRHDRPPGEGFQRFQRASDLVEGQWLKMIVVRCSHKGCGYQERIRDNTSTGMPQVLAAEKFRQKGWKLGGGPSSDLCPRCARAGKRPARGSPRDPTAVKMPPVAPKVVKLMSPAQRRAAYCAIAGVPRAKSKPQETKPVATAEQPRQPTIPERRSIMEELEAHYDVAAERYMAAFSDDAIAAKLDVPRAWVSDVRTGLFGLNGGNETDLQFAEGVAGLETMLADALDLLGRIDADLQRLKAGKPLKAATKA